LEFQTSEDTVPIGLISDEQSKQLIGRPPASGGWQDGDPIGNRHFTHRFDLPLEAGGELSKAVIAYESWGELNQDKSNAVLVLHALTGDSHTVGPASKAHPTNGWWDDLIGPGKAIDTNEYFVVTPNIIGGCQGSTGPGSLSEKGLEYGPDFPHLTIRDQTLSLDELTNHLELESWFSVIGGSMGGMHALEYAISRADKLGSLGILAAPAASSADQIAINSVQMEAIRTDSQFFGGRYYDKVAGMGPHRGLALARRMALLNYRSPTELNARFKRSWQSELSPFGEGGRFSIESYLDFHGNKFTRRFDANSYISLAEAMNTHDVGRDRGGVEKALAQIKVKTLVVGISSDRLFPVQNQQVIADHIGGELVGGELQVIESEYGHDGFLIEKNEVGKLLKALLQV